jgi:hypothetical protein
MAMRKAIVFVMGLVVLGLGVPPAAAGSPHFVQGIDIDRDGNSLTVSGKIAGLGDEAQVEVQITVDAECINPGGNKPKAANKETLAAAGTFPVQNGKANFSLTVTATFQPDCTPPMTLRFSNLTVTDVTHDLSQSFPGPF